MVIFSDLHKLLLYQKLNLGFECQVCKKKFYSRFDHLQHTINCKEQLKCTKCGKVFGHHQILQLHMQFHNLRPADDSQATTECVQLIDSDTEDSCKTSCNVDQETRTTSGNQTTDSVSDIVQEERITQEKNQSLQSIDTITSLSRKKKPSHKNKSKPVKKKIGLTKIKMEDCLRCDECSCIYIDEKDYYKHMRNFHQLDVNHMPIIRQKTKRKCRSCCKQCRGVNCSPVKRPRATLASSNLIFKINMRDNIKNRWTKMVSQQLSDFPMAELIAEPVDPDIQIKPDPDPVTIKTEPDDTLDLSHLLSQVEVKIKTEPADDYDI